MVLSDAYLAKQRAAGKANGCPTSCSAATFEPFSPRDLGDPDRAAGDRRRAPAADTAHHARAWLAARESCRANRHTVAVAAAAGQGAPP